MKKREVWILVLLICIVLATFFLDITSEEEGLYNLKSVFSFDWLFKGTGGLPYGYDSGTDNGDSDEPGGGCLEIWECDEWSYCNERGFRTRECIEHTGCVLYFHKPITSMSCNETCFDRIKNQDEEGIDCGGICEPCVNLRWSDFDKGKVLSLFITGLLGLLIAILLILFFVWKPKRKKKKRKTLKVV